MNLTAEQMLTVTDDDGSVTLHGGDLYHYAAEDAARVLVQNWEQVLIDEPGLTLRHLTPDVDRVIQILDHWQARVRSIYQEGR